MAKVKELKLDRFNITRSVEPAGYVRIEEDPEDRYGALSYVFGFGLAALFFLVLSFLLNRSEWYPVVTVILVLFTAGFTIAAVDQWRFAKSTGNKTYLFTPECCEIISETGSVRRFPKTRILSIYTLKEITNDMSRTTNVRYDIVLKLKGRFFGTRRKKLLFFDSRLADLLAGMDMDAVKQMEKECMQLTLIIAEFWNVPAKT